jgi:hypothetical protein
VLTRSGVQADQLGVLVTTCPGCGSLVVRQGGVAIATIDLRSATSRSGVLKMLPVFARLRTGAVTLTSAGSRTAQVDGLVVVRRS